jgi:hypothetical protein
VYCISTLFFFVIEQVLYTTTKLEKFAWLSMQNQENMTVAHKQQYHEQQILFIELLYLSSALLQLLNCCCLQKAKLFRANCEYWSITFMGFDAIRK